MENIRLYPQFKGELDDMLKLYNSGNGTYYLYAEPQLGTGMTQYILIENKQKSNEEIMQSLEEQEIEMIYYTGPFSKSTGQGLTGIGRIKYRFKIKDAINIYSNKTDLFS